MTKLDSYSAAARAALADFEPAGDPRAETSVARLRELLSGPEDPCARRSFSPGHLTGSAIVLSPDHHSCVLIWHRKLERWLQPGGHVEPEDDVPVATARREAVEECGVEIDTDFEPVLVQVDVHEIPAHGDEPEHHHHDLVYLLRARDFALEAADEVGRAIWCALDESDAYVQDEALADAIRRTRRYLSAG